MSGEMSLWEYQALVSEWAARQPKADGGIAEYTGPTPTEDEVQEMIEKTAETVARAKGAK